MESGKSASVTSQVILGFLGVHLAAAVSAEHSYAFRAQVKILQAAWKQQVNPVLWGLVYVCARSSEAPGAGTPTQRLVEPREHPLVLDALSLLWLFILCTRVIKSKQRAAFLVSDSGDAYYIDHSTVLDTLVGRLSALRFADRAHAAPDRYAEAVWDSKSCSVPGQWKCHKTASVSAQPPPPSHSVMCTRHYCVILTVAAWAFDFFNGFWTWIL